MGNEKLLEKVNILERSCKRWQQLTMVMFLLVATLALMGARELNRTTVAVGQLRLLNKKGQLRAVLGLTKKDMTFLALRDSNGVVRSHLHLNEDGAPSLVFNDDKGDKRCLLSLADNNNPTLFFYDDKNVRRLSLTSSPSALICNNHNGKPRAVLGVSKAGAGAFSLEDVHGRPIIYKRLK